MASTHSKKIDHQIHADQRVHLGDVAADAGHGGTEGGEVDDRGRAGEVLQDDAPGVERDLLLADVLRVVAGQDADVFLGDDEPVTAWGASQRVARVRRVSTGESAHLLVDLQGGDAIEIAGSGVSFSPA